MKAEGGTQGTSGGNRRRRRYIWPELQVMIALLSVFVTLGVLFLHFNLVSIDARAVQRLLPPPVPAPVAALSNDLWKDFLIAVALAIPLSVSASILYSFAFAGPIYRIHRYLRGLIDGRWDISCALRKGDKLRDVEDALNDAVQLLVGRIQSQREVLRKARSFLEGAWSAGDQQKVETLLDMIDREEAALAGRFAGDGAEVATAAESERAQRQAVTT